LFSCAIESSKDNNVLIKIYEKTGQLQDIV